MASERVTTVLDAEEHVSEAAKQAAGAIQGFTQQNESAGAKVGAVWTEVAAKYLVIREAIRKVSEAFNGLLESYSQQENAERRLAVAVRQNPLLNGESLGRFRE
ncbi:MAG: hypothetical protein IT186_14035, partial [Acidobacteria bacterium]|nr:hypothetical protein [Acidobacteriota bacterium]